MVVNTLWGIPGMDCSCSFAALSGIDKLGKTLSAGCFAASANSLAVRIINSAIFSVGLTNAAWMPRVGVGVRVVEFYQAVNKHRATERLIPAVA